MKIDRIVISFDDVDKDLSNYTDDFFEIGILLERLLQKYYCGSKIHLLNIQFFSKSYFLKYPIVAEVKIKYFGGHVHYNYLMDYSYFDELNREEKVKFLWVTLNEIIIEIASFKKNNSLKDAILIAFEEGLKININPDYKLVESQLTINGVNYNAIIWLNFGETRMNANLEIYQSDKVVFTQFLLGTDKGNPAFLVVFKKVECDAKNIIIKGRYDVKQLPIKISIEDFFKY
jgi:hypothetical protein